GEPIAVARGTYADIWHWLETGAVDLAVVSPALLGKALELDGAVRWEYLASVSTPSDPSPSLSIAVVREDSPLRTVEDLRSRLRIPRNALIVRADLPQLDRLRKTVSTPAPVQTGASFLAEPTWRESVAEVRGWLAAVGAVPPDRLMRLDLDELGDLLLHDVR